MHTPEIHEYDVVIMGAGFAGLCQARHLMLNLPHLKVALIDPRPEDRLDTDLKIGESTIEIAALFLAKELGLQDYLIEHQIPKSGLSFHWSKNSDKTETLDDYYHIWSNRPNTIASYQIHRPKFERDLLKMNQEMGIAFYNGRVMDVDLTPGDTIKTVKVQIDKNNLELKAKHVIDAAGRKFIIGRKTNNLLSGPENLLGLNNGSAWVRVKNIDRSIFHDGYDPQGATTSHYFSTNHYFGPGHWIWMIPIDNNSQELSLGVMHHHDVIASDKLNSLEKFKAFLQANHSVLYHLIESGELVDFHYWPKVAHKSKVMFSPDNWYVLGDAAYIFDAFYSYGTTTIALAIEGITEIIRAKLAGEADAEKKRAAYNEFNLAYARLVNSLYRGHAKHLGHASVMSWRIYFEYMWWFGINVPMYIGKWHLDLKFLPALIHTLHSNVDGLFAYVGEQFSQLVDQGANIGLMDAHRGDQLVKGYYTAKYFDDFLVNTKLEPQRCNIYACLKHTCFYVALWYALFQWKGFGIRGVVSTAQSLSLLPTVMAVRLYRNGGAIYQWQTRRLPANTEIAKMREAFKDYRYSPELQPWLAEVAKQTQKQTIETELVSSGTSSPSRASAAL